MSKTIWKYTLGVDTTLLIPKGGKILSAAGQNDDVCIWVLVDPQAPEEPRFFTVYGTGHIIPDKRFRDSSLGTMQHIGTALLHNSSLVLHVFELS